MCPCTGKPPLTTFQFQVPAICKVSCTSLASIDSRASSNFINLTFAQARHLPIHKKLVLEQVEVIFQPVCYDTAPLQVEIKDHQEIMRFIPILPLHFWVTLGLSWLSGHYPSISWVVRKAWFDFRFCWL